VVLGEIIIIIITAAIAVTATQLPPPTTTPVPNNNISFGVIVFSFVFREVNKLVLVFILLHNGKWAAKCVTSFPWGCKHFTLKT
jgi:hypothetical protein